MHIKVEVKDSICRTSVWKLKLYQIRFLIGAILRYYFVGTASCPLTLTWHQRRDLSRPLPGFALFYVVATVSPSLVEGNAVSIHVYRTATAYIGELFFSEMAQFPVYVYAQTPPSDTKTATKPRLVRCPTANGERMA